MYFVVESVSDIFYGQYIVGSIYCRIYIYFFKFIPPYDDVLYLVSKGQKCSHIVSCVYFMEYWYWFRSNGEILGSILDVLRSIYCSKNGSCTKGVPIGIESIFFGDLDGKQVSGCPINPIKIQIFTYPPYSRMFRKEQPFIGAYNYIYSNQ